MPLNITIPNCKQLRDYTEGKNIYTETCLGILKKKGAVRELQNGIVMLHSMLFRAAILIHLYTHANTNIGFKDLIERFMKNSDHTGSYSAGVHKKGQAS
jgi:hypothetical protein